MALSEAQLRAALDAHLPAGATSLVVAVSGGSDSLSLLRGVAALGMSFRGLPTRAVHIDHGLSQAAPAFRRACATVCAELGVPLRVIAVAIESRPGESLEAAARDARYAALEAELAGGECLLTAHHGLDQAETLLLQAVRGAGLKGIAGMPICRPLGRGWHLRPALDAPHEELGGHDAAVEDPMNADPRFDRSFLRREIWPLIEARWPGARAALARSAAHAAEAQRLLDRVGAESVARLRDGEALSVPALRALSVEARMNAVRFWLGAQGVEVPSTSKLREALRQMLEARDDHQPSVVWGAHALRRYRQRLLLTAARPPRLAASREWAVEPAAALDLGASLGRLRWSRQPGGLDPARLPRALEVRARRGGETLRTSIRGRTQSVQHLCQAHGVLPWMRDALPLLLADGELVAVADLWLEARRRTAAGELGLAVEWEEAPAVI